MKMMTVKVLVSLVLLAVGTNGLLASYGICQTGCNAVAMACYTAAGFTFGTVTAGTGIPAVIVGCNTALGTCMAGCVAALISPLP